MDTIDNNNHLNQIKKYVYHKKIFNIENNIYLKPFENLLKSSKDYHLTCTCKIENKKIYPCRFFIDFSSKNTGHLIKNIFSFFKKAGQLKNVNLNFDYIKKTFDKDLNVHEVKKMIAGVDLRKNPEDSRIKIYIIIEGSKLKCEQLSKMLNYLKTQKTSKDHDYILGIDLFLNGKSKIKLYQIYTEKDLANDITKKTFQKYYSQKINKMIENSASLIVCLEEERMKETGDIRLDFNIRNADFFANIINSETVKDTRNKIVGQHAGTYDIQQIALYKNEIDCGRIKNANIYY